MNNNKNVTWYQIEKWWPILVSVVLISVSYASVITRITVVESKLDNLITILSSYEVRQERIVNNYNDLNSRIVVIETKLNLNQQSDR